MINFQNLYKRFIFKKDIFSKNRIYLKKVKINHNLKKIIFKLGFKKKYLLQKVISNDLNSKTYKISAYKKSYLIKIEKKNLNILDVLYILKNEKFSKKIITPINLKEGKNYLLYKKSLITLYPYIEGKLYSGTKLELSSSINEIIRLFSKLSKINRYKNFNKFNYFSKEEEKLIIILKKKRKMFNVQFSNKKFEFQKFIPLIIFEWKRLKKRKNIYFGKKQLSFWDIHPHNLITKENRIKGIIDLTGIKYMPIGYTLSYGLIKLLRQYFIKEKIKKNYHLFARSYIKKINFQLGTKFNNEIFYDLAVSEVLRRILIIIKKNIFKKDKSFNHIMPILLSNLVECKFIFGNYAK